MKTKLKPWNSMSTTMKVIVSVLLTGAFVLPIIDVIAFDESAIILLISMATVIIVSGIRAASRS
jgi:hypothetical protein